MTSFSKTGLPISPALEITALQYAWLKEMGISSPLLAPYRAVPAPSLQAKTSKVIKEIQKVKAAPSISTIAPVNPVVATKPALPVVSTQLPDKLSELQAHAQACQACTFYQQRDQLVFGAGDTHQPTWLIVGEAPGQADDRTGLPFQGKPGDLLAAMLIAMGVLPETFVPGSAQMAKPKWVHPVSAYFTNLVKCRPLRNVSPSQTELEACWPYLQAQIAALQPRFILTLGRLAAQLFLKLATPLEELRGKVYKVSIGSELSIPLVPTWHPSSLLLHPQHKAQAWEDLALARRLMNESRQ